VEVDLHENAYSGKNAKHHHGYEDGKEYIRSMMENKLYLMDRFDYDDTSEILIFEKK
jgi:hypothetical protein